MTKEEAIQVIRANGLYYVPNNTPVFEMLIDAFDMAIEALEDNESLAKSLNDAVELIHKLQKKKEWIPCSERLPKMPEDYLVCDNRGNIFVNFFSTTTHHWANGDSLIEAWMPLPSPYKGEEE